jgi:uncharacterized circularly permuted ATP-grasp superfamily protein/uncharacterized alpha-E superfamily protein
MSQENSRPKDAVDALLSAYRLTPGARDEMLDASGAVRPVWRALVDRLATASEKERVESFARGDQYLRDAGVFFRDLDIDATAERDWPLSHIPVVIDDAEWQSLSAGLVERADLLERVIADLYGPQSLVSDGHIPASLVANNPNWLRPLVGVAPGSGYYLDFIAFEIARGPDGRWWVLSDRTEAPAGAGFAIENRVATTRIYNDHFTRENVHRLAGFFRDYRDRLYSLRQETDSRIAVLTPGPNAGTHFEDAYIARYLGMMLLQGQDLTTRDGQLMVRTVAGLRPISVLWRKLRSTAIDPLELDETSGIGTSGMLNAIRQGSATLINFLGTGAIESRAMLAFLPRISRALTGKPLTIPNIATWWCGQDSQRALAISRGNELVFGAAQSSRLPFDERDATVEGAHFAHPDYASLADWIEAEGADIVGQETIALSTSPAFVDGKLVPRPMNMRVFLARTHTGWKVMPGGYARIGHSPTPTVMSMRGGGRVADVWVVSDKPVTEDTMLAKSGIQFTRPQPGTLPSRASENLYWLGRYVERSEGLIRMVRAYHIRLTEGMGREAPLTTHMKWHFREFGVDETQSVPIALHNALESAVRSASEVRDRFSVDGWVSLTELTRSARQLGTDLAPGDETARAMGMLLRQLAGFSGLVRENMYRFTGWRFLSIGRAIERAADMSTALAHYADAAAPEGALELAVELGDSAMSHRRRYSVSTNRETVMDLLAFDPMNPRSIMFQLDEILDHIRFLPGSDAAGHMAPLNREILLQHTALATKTPDTIDTAMLHELRATMNRLSTLLSSAHL